MNSEKCRFCQNFRLSVYNTVQASIRRDVESKIQQMVGIGLTNFSVGEFFSYTVKKITNFGRKQDTKTILFFLMHVLQLQASMLCVFKQICLKVNRRKSGKFVIFKQIC
jgi:hypothetical protein